VAGRVGCRTGVYQQNGRVGLQWATSVGVFVLNLGPGLECPVKGLGCPLQSWRFFETIPGTIIKRQLDGMDSIFCHVLQ